MNNKKYIKSILNLIKNFILYINNIINFLLIYKLEKSFLTINTLILYDL